MRIVQPLINLVLVAAVVAGVAGYKADLVASTFPAAGPFAKSVRALMPTALVGAPATATTQAAPTAPARPPVSVVVGAAAKKDLPWTIEAIGTAQPIASVALRTRYDAMVDKVLVADGASVKAGDTLIMLDSKQLQAQLGVAQAQLAKDQAQFDQSSRDVARTADLVARNAAAGVNLETYKTAVASATAAIQGDKAAIDNLNVQLSWSTITAPISGRIGVVSTKAGNIAKAGDNSPTGVLATINQVSPIYVSFSLSQTLLPAIRKAMAEGAKVTARPQGSKTPVVGKLVLIDNAVDSATGTIVARAAFENADEALWPGQLCNLTISLAMEPGQVVAPREAIQNGQNGPFVYAVKDGVAHVTPVEVGRQQGGEIVIAKGLVGDETLVVDGALLLTEGSKVAPRAASGGA